MKNIAVIGSGTMGNGIAHVFAQAGYSVSLIDISADALNKATSTISKNLDRQVAKGALKEEDKANTLKNITTYTELEKGVKDCALVIEAATENPEIKFKLFRDLAQVCSEGVILASNTSSISITKIAAQ